MVCSGELSDPSYEHTFDLPGEYILYKVLCAVSEFDDESWKTSVTAEEMIELYSMIACSKTIACMEVCEVDELSELSRIEMTELMNDITTTIWNILHAPEYLQNPGRIHYVGLRLPVIGRYQGWKICCVC